MEESPNINEEDIELMSENIEYLKKLNFDVIVFRHIDRTNRVLSLGDPLAYGNCVAGLYAMLEWFFDEKCIEKLNKLKLTLNEKTKALIGDKTQLSDAEKTTFEDLQYQHVVDKCSILIDLLGRKGKLWMKT